MSALGKLRSFAEAREADDAPIRDGLTYGDARELVGVMIGYTRALRLPTPPPHALPILIGVRFAYERLGATEEALAAIDELITYFSMGDRTGPPDGMA